ncbi:Molecular chaperone (HSP90 family), partial [Pseudoloma neurophilia]
GKEKVTEDSEGKEEEKESVEETQLNKEKPLWSMPNKEITPEMYNSFYKTISNDWDDPMAVKHSHLEGSISFDVLLYAPKRPPFSMFDQKKKKTIKLYCSSIFITDDLDLPEWMQCVTGIISSKDLPINVSREFLQGSNIKRIIKKTLMKKTVEMIKEMDQSKYLNYYREFSSMIKLAARDEDPSLGLDKLLLFTSNKRENVSLQNYEFKEGQNDIYIITGTSLQEVKNSPFVSLFSDYEVLFFIDTIDEYLLQKLRTFNNKNITKINQEGVELPHSDISEEMVESLKGLKEKILSVLSGNDSEKSKNTISDDLLIEKVEFKNLKDRHMIVQTPKHGISPAMEKIMAAQVSLDKNNMFMFPKGKKILYVNVTHPLTFKLNNLLNDDQKFRELLTVCMRVACLQCGYNLDDPVMFSEQVISLLTDDSVGENENNDKVVEEKVL